MLELNKLYNMDCMEGMKEIPDKYFDLAVVDPEYGINVTKMSMGTNKNRKVNGYSGISIADRLREKYKDNNNYNWDTKPAGKEYFNELFRVSKNQIIWGGNYFELPPTRCIYVWDKMQNWQNFSQIEIAWTSFNKPSKIFRHSNTGGDNKEKKICVCQKPIALYIDLLNMFAERGYKILDTHVGSASSLIACYRIGLDFIGFERDKCTYKLANDRLERERQQITLRDIEL